jgi:uncharacterized protein YceK
MKRIFLIAAVTLTLSSCGSKETNDATTNATDSATIEATTEATENASETTTVADSTKK